MYLPNDLMEEDMKKLDFVKWDRFVVNEKKKSLGLYGWIAREDTHEDFVLLDYTLCDDGKWTISFSCSSEKRSKDIFRILECQEKYNDCQRVEDIFDIKNCIRLKR